MIKDSTIYRPRGTEYQRLLDISQGGAHIITSAEKMGASLLKEIDLEELVMELYEINSNDRGRWAKYSYMDEPVFENNEWYIRKHLTERGQYAMESMAVGWLWNHDAMDVDVEATVEHYRSFLRRGSVPLIEAEQLVGNSDDRLREVRNEMVYFKLRGTTTNGTIRGPKSE